MRIFGKKIFENKYQQQLDKLSDYGKRRSPQELLNVVSEFDTDLMGAFYGSVKMWHHFISEGFSIRDIVESKEYAEFSWRYQSSKNGEEQIRKAVMGSELVIARLIERSNALARGIQPGASEQMANAFDDPTKNT